MRPFLLLLAGLLSVVACRADEPVVRLKWRDRYVEAAADAAKSQRFLLLNFTGSDWCIWCHRLSDEVFNTPVFAKCAEESLVLVEVDFPRRKFLPPDLVRQNDALSDRYGVEGYPTVLLVTPDGEVVGRMGYMEGGPKTFVRELKRLMATRKPTAPTTSSPTTP